MSEPITSIRTPMRLDYNYVAGQAQSRFLKAIANGKILGSRCSGCVKVFVPLRESCPTCAIPTSEDIELSDKGTVTTFCIVNLPFYGQALEIPYVCASVLLDGADLTLFQLIQETPADQVKMGMRVEAVWVPPEELKPNMESIKYFRPIDRSPPSPGAAGSATDA